MPLNQIKVYPELLELAFLDERSRIKSLRAIFDRDMANNDNFKFRGCKIYPVKTDGEIDMNREFKHLTHEEIIEEDEQRRKVPKRVYDPYRSERLHWLRHHIDSKVTDSEIHIFSHKERNQRKRVDIIRTYIYNKTRKYVIVFEPQTRNGHSYYLLTAYYLNKSYGEKMIEKKLKSKLEDVL